MQRKDGPVPEMGVKSNENTSLGLRRSKDVRVVRPCHAYLSRTDNIMPFIPQQIGKMGREHLVNE